MLTGLTANCDALFHAIAVGNPVEFKGTNSEGSKCCGHDSDWTTLTCCVHKISHKVGSLSVEVCE